MSRICAEERGYEMSLRCHVMACCSLLWMLPSGLLAQSTEGCNSFEVQASVMMMDGRMVQGIAPEGFTAQMNGRAAAIQRASADESPRRILIVLDTGRMDPAQQTILDAVLSRILLDSRAGDSFALLATRGPALEVPFGKPGRDLHARAVEQRALKEGPKSKQGPLESVIKGTQWFDGGQAGDAILLLTSEVEQSDDMDYGKLLKVLRSRNIRLFTFLAGRFVSGAIYTVMMPGNPGSAVPEVSSSIDTSNVRSLTWEAGGVFFHEDTRHPWRKYELKDDRLEELRRAGWQMYGAIAALYTIQVRTEQNRRKGRIHLDLVSAVRKEAPRARLYYPREVSCQEDRPANKK